MYCCRVCQERKPRNWESHHQGSQVFDRNTIKLKAQLQYRLPKKKKSWSLQYRKPFILPLNESIVLATFLVGKLLKLIQRLFHTAHTAVTVQAGQKPGMFLPIQLPGKSYHLQQQASKEEHKNRETSPSLTISELQQHISSTSPLATLSQTGLGAITTARGSQCHTRPHTHSFLPDFSAKHLQPQKSQLQIDNSNPLETEGCHKEVHSPTLPQHQRGAWSQVTALPVHGGDSQPKAQCPRARYLWQVWELWARTAVWLKDTGPSQLRQMKLNWVISKPFPFSDATAGNRSMQMTKIQSFHPQFPHHSPVVHECSFWLQTLSPRFLSHLRVPLTFPRSFFEFPEYFLAGLAAPPDHCSSSCSGNTAWRWYHQGADWAIFSPLSFFFKITFHKISWSGPRRLSPQAHTPAEYLTT